MSRPIPPVPMKSHDARRCIDSWRAAGVTHVQFLQREHVVSVVLHARPKVTPRDGVVVTIDADDLFELLTTMKRVP